MRLDELEYNLPPERIATHPLSPRDHARLMVVHRATGELEHRRVYELPKVLSRVAGPEAVMVFNRTKVLPAAFEAVREATGGRVSGLFVETEPRQPSRWVVMLEARGRLEAGETLRLGEAESLTLQQRLEGGRFLAEVQAPDPDPLDVLHPLGRTPLPPYIVKRRKELGESEADPADAERYNTVFGQEAGSVAAPTASLHFTQALLERIDATGLTRTELTLHVGPGTFQPIRSKSIAEHRMHGEWIHVPRQTMSELHAARHAGRKVVAVGTTSVRALESLPEGFDPPRCGDPSQWPEGFSHRTELFIRPAEPGETPFRFRFTDVLMTNFHLPRSTLLAMVAALPGVGVPRLLAWYAEAVRRGYRFYSYGDAMLLA